MAAQLEHTDKSSEPGCLSFKDLADVLSAQKSVPSLAQLDELIDRTKIGAEEVQPYLGFKAGNYSPRFRRSGSLAMFDATRLASSIVICFASKASASVERP